MSDADLKAHWNAISDPVEMLKAIVENSEFLGGDSYYSDLLECILTNAERVCVANGGSLEQKSTSPDAP